MENRTKQKIVWGSKKRCNFYFSTAYYVPGSKLNTLLSFKFHNDPWGSINNYQYVIIDEQKGH